MWVTLKLHSARFLHSNRFKLLLYDMADEVVAYLNVKLAGCKPFSLWCHIF